MEVNMSKYKLTIAVLTMNRADQMRHAVVSCLNSALPIDTQFLIVDNASTDHTQRVASELKDKSKYALLYYRLSENRGVGGGRNVCFDLAEGEYLYILDDDAEIQDCIRQLIITDAGTGFMHESFHKDDASNFTREWFAWQNTLFGELILKIVNDGKVHLLNDIQ